MITETLTDTSRIVDLFFARHDVFAYQFWNEARQAGGYGKACTQQPPWSNIRCLHKKQGQRCGNCEHFAPIPVDIKVVDLHLRGAMTMGSYQIGTDGTSIKWACLDFDDHGESEPDELQSGALVAHAALTDWGLPASIEASGGSGWRCHIWLFFSGTLPAIKARVVLDAMLRETGLSDKPFIERFPKQTRALNGYGNLVKVPFGKHQRTGRRSCFLNPATLEPMSDMRHALDSITLIDPTTVDFLIDMKHLSLEEARSGEARPAKNFDYPAEGIHKILSRCWYFREVERQQTNDECSVHYEDWWHYVLMFSRFGDAGSKRILALSRIDERYDEEYTLAIINYVREHGYHPPSCRRLREGPGQIHCPYDPMECRGYDARSITV